MRLSRIYTDTPLAVGHPTTLDEAQSHYLKNVLRAKVGREVVLFNGRGGEYLARISQLGRRDITLDIEQFDPIDRESPLALHLLQCVSKNEHMDLSLQKAIELGVHSITPIFSERSPLQLDDKRLDKKISHWQGIIRSASEQSGRTRLAPLLPPMELTQYLQYLQTTQSDPQQDSQQHYLDTHLKSAQQLLFQPCATQPLGSLSLHAPIAVLVGAEGGLSETEIQQCEQKGFQSALLGPRILRTETATIAILSLLQHKLGDLG